MGACVSKAAVEEMLREKDIRINELAGDLDTAKSEKNAALDEAQELNKRLEEELEKTAKLEAVLEDTRKEKDEKISELNEDNETLERQLNRSEAKQDEYALEIQQLKASIAKKEKDIAALKEKSKGWRLGKKKDGKEDSKLKEPSVDKGKRKNSRSVLNLFSKDKSAQKKVGSISEEESKTEAAAQRKQSLSDAESEYSSSGYEPLDETPSIKAAPETKSTSTKEAGAPQATSEFLKDQSVLYVGELDKKNPGGIAGVHLWKTRFCVLTAKGFYYFGKASDPKPKGTILLEQIRTVAHQPQDARKFGIAINGENRVYEWRADNDEAVDRWIKAIDDARQS